MQIHNKVAQDLHGILAKKFESLTIADQSAISTVEPGKGRIFTLEYGSSGKSYGSVTVNIVDPNALVIYYNTNISEDMRYDAKKDWYSFLKELRFFAKRNLMSFDVRNIGKDQLDKQDYAYIKTNDNSYDSSEVQMESKLTGTLKTSYQSFGETRLVIKHTSPVDEEKRGARTRHIHSLFIETNGERIKLPFKSLIAGRAFAQHVNNNGLFDDAIGQHIQELTQEAYDLKKFVKTYKRADNFAEQEEATKLIQQARERYQGIRETLKTLSGPKGYKSYVEQYQPTEDYIEQADLDEIRSKLIRIEQDNIVDTVLPSLARGNNKMNVQEGNTELAMALAKDPTAKLELLPNSEEDQEIKDYINHIKQNVIRNKKTSENPSDGIVNKILVSLVKRTADDELSMAINDLAMKAMAPEGGDMAAKKAAYQIASKYLKGNVEVIEPKAKKKLKQETDQYEDIMNNLSEGTWAIPDTPEQIDALEKAMAEPLTLGAEGENATSTMYGIIGDDELFDDLGEAGDKNPEGDARPIVANWVKENLANYQGMPEELVKKAHDIVAKFEGKPATQESVSENEVPASENVLQLVTADMKKLEAEQSDMAKQGYDEDVEMIERRLKDLRQIAELVKDGGYIAGVDTAVADEVVDYYEKAGEPLPFAEAKVDEEEVDEDNAFNTAAAKAAMAGETHFTFNGKKYPVKMSKADAEKLLDDVNEMDDHPDHMEADAEEIADAIKWRITASPITLDKILKHTDMRSLLDAIEQEAEFHAPMDELGSSDISAMVNGVMKTLGIKEANEEGTPDIVEQAVQAYKGKKNENMYEVFKNFAKEDLDAIIKTGYLPEAEVEETTEEVVEEAKDKEPVQWPSQPIEEGKLGFKDLEEFGKEMASKIDTEARKRGSADMEPGEADELRFKIAKEFGLVEDKKEKEQTVEQHEIDEILYLAGVK